MEYTFLLILKISASIPYIVLKPTFLLNDATISLAIANHGEAGVI